MTTEPPHSDESDQPSDEVVRRDVSLANPMRGISARVHCFPDQRGVLRQRMVGFSLVVVVSSVSIPAVLASFAPLLECPNGSMNGGGDASLTGL